MLHMNTHMHEVEAESAPVSGRHNDILRLG